MSRRFWGLFITLFLLQGAPVATANSTQQFKPVALSDLARFSADQGAIDLKDLPTFIEYLKITDCHMFQTVKDSQFRQQELQNATIARIQKEDMAHKGSDLFLSLPTTFLTSGYNFDTQSMDIIPLNRLQRVNSLMLYDQRTPICNQGLAAYKKMPIFHWVQLNFPVSLHRIPLQRSLAETLTAKLDRNRGNESQRIIYGNILVQVERIEPEIKKSTHTTPVAYLRGQVVAIDLYVDFERKVRFKRLSYLDTF